jgi:hypothetical protein
MESLNPLALSRLVQCFGWGLVFAVFVILTAQDVRKGRVLRWPTYLLHNLDRVLPLFVSLLFGYLMVAYRNTPADLTFSILLNLLMGASMAATAWQMARRAVRHPPEMRPTPHNEGIGRTVDETPLLQYIRSRWSQDELLAALARLDPGVLRQADRLLASGEAHKHN